MNLYDLPLEIINLITLNLDDKSWYNCLMASKLFHTNSVKEINNRKKRNIKWIEQDLANYFLEEYIRKGAVGGNVHLDMAHPKVRNYILNHWYRFMVTNVLGSDFAFPSIEWYFEKIFRIPCYEIRISFGLETTHNEYHTLLATERIRKRNPPLTYKFTKK